jgi:hypothetical protein
VKYPFQQEFDVEGGRGVGIPGSSDRGSDTGRASPAAGAVLNHLQYLIQKYTGFFVKGFRKSDPVGIIIKNIDVGLEMVIRADFIPEGHVPGGTEVDLGFVDVVFNRYTDVPGGAHENNRTDFPHEMAQPVNGFDFFF